MLNLKEFRFNILELLKQIMCAKKSFFLCIKGSVQKFSIVFLLSWGSWKSQIKTIMVHIGPEEAEISCLLAPKTFAVMQLNRVFVTPSLNFFNFPAPDRNAGCKCSRQTKATIPGGCHLSLLLLCLFGQFHSVFLINPICVVL